MSGYLNDKKKNLPSNEPVIQNHELPKKKKNLPSSEPVLQYHELPTFKE